MNSGIEAKLALIAQMLDGRVVKHENSPAHSVHGYVLGFPCRLEALGCSWPFGVTYFVDTEVIASSNSDKETFQLEAIPRVGKRFLGFVTRLLFFEAAGMSVGEKDLDQNFVFSYNNRPLVERYLRYPGISETLLKLHRHSSFNELIVASKEGLRLSQSTSLSKLDLDLCREIFKLLGEMGQVLYDAF